MRKAWLLLVTAAFLVACGTNFIQEGLGSPTPPVSPTPTVIASPPPFATFQSDIQPIMETKLTSPGGCGTTGTCHDSADSAGVGYLWYTTAGAATPVGEIMSNYKLATCTMSLDQYNPPTGPFFTNFCNADGTALATQHLGRGNFSNADCLKWVNWIKSGGTGFTPPCN